MTTEDDLRWKNIETLRMLTEQRLLRANAKARRRDRDRSQPGRIQQRLCKLMQEAGIPIPDAYRFWIQEGGYRHHHWDLARWGADFRDEQGRFWRIYSWCTMTECVRYGIDCDLTGDPGDFQIGSRKP